MAYFKAKNAPNSISAAAPPQTPLEELTALPRPHSWIWGLLLRGGEERGGGEGNMSTPSINSWLRHWSASAELLVKTGRRPAADRVVTVYWTGAVLQTITSSDY